MNKILKKQIILNLLILLLFSQTIIAQEFEGNFQSFYSKNNEITIKLNTGIYKITPFGEKVIHTQFFPNGNETKYFSFAVDKKAEKIKYRITEKGNLIYVNTKGIKIRIIKNPFSISYFYENELLIKENKACELTDTLSKFNFTIEKDEMLFGGGSRVLGMNKRGYKLELYNRAHYGFETHSELMNYSIPMFLSSKKYAVLFDNPAKGFLDLDSKKTNNLSFEALGGAMNYYVIAGDNWYNLVDEYTDLTGRQPLPPRWAFGNFASRFGYHSQEEVLNTANKFFTDSIPLEAIIIDIYWFGKEIMGTMGNLDWHKDSFPEPKKMIAELHAKNVKTILVTEPFILTTSKKWKEAESKGVLAKNKNGEAYTYDFFFGNTGLVDIFDKNVRVWFWDIYKDLMNQGVEGWWGDLGEPEVHPSDLQHVIGSADKVHNAYGHRWAQTIFEGYKKDFPEKRPFILMRAGFAGSQRYGIIPWTGDVNRSWGGLISQPEISLGMGMQGVAYMHSDLGGFAGNSPLDDELYIRWLQYGVFQPIYRPHAQESVSPEPVFQNDTTKAHVKRAIELRYKLLPYIYNMAFENNQTGKPLMIPLFFNETDNKELMNYDNAYMWGDAFLVSPIKAANVRKQNVYLPKGSNWTDFYTEKTYKGGQEITVDVNINNIPIFVKGGSFIPVKKEVANTANYNLDNFVMHYYSDKNITESEYKLYNDDGETPNAFEKGKYEIIEFEVEKKAGNLIIEIEKEVSLSAKAKNIDFVLHNIGSKPKSVKKGSENLEWKYNSESKKIHFSVTLTNSTKVKIKL